MLRATLLITLSVVLSGFTGCLLNHENHTVVRQDEPLNPVTFESEQAKTTFEDFVHNALTNDDNESRSSFGVPFIVGISKSRTTAEAAVRNDAATRFDVNGDHHISDYESSLYRY